MKKLLLAIFLSSCAGYQHGARNLLRQSSAEERQQLYWQATASQHSFQLLEGFRTQDSLQYRIRLHTDGPYRISADSGIQGSGAQIWLDGLSFRQVFAIKSERSDSTLTTHDQSNMQTSSRHESEEKQQRSTRIRFSAYWLILPIVLLILLWYAWKRW